MLIIVVFLSAMLFVWAISSFGVYQGGAGYWFSSKSLANQERVSIENVNFVTVGASHYVKIYVRNVGAVPFTVGGVYVNGSLLPSISPASDDSPARRGEWPPSSGGSSSSSSYSWAST